MRLLLLSVLILAGCSSPPPAPVQVKLTHLPPAPKDVIATLLASSASPLTDATCHGFGTALDDATLGQYLAGYLAELSNQDHRNAVTTSVERQTSNGEPVYLCRVMVRHAQGEDVWSWGVEFAARQKDGVVIPGSVRCLGAG